jgi:hypothetical protein
MLCSGTEKDALSSVASASGKLIPGEEVPTAGLADSAENNISATTDISARKRKSDAAAMAGSEEFTAVATKKAKVVLADAPVEKKRPVPRPVTKAKRSTTSSTTVSGNAQQKIAAENPLVKKRPIPAQDNSGDDTDPATPVPPAKKAKGNIRRTGKSFIFHFLLFKIVNDV